MSIKPRLETKSLAQTDEEIRRERAILAREWSQAEVDLIAEIDRTDPLVLLDALVEAVHGYLNAHPETVDDMTVPMHHLSMAYLNAFIYRRKARRDS